VAKTNRFGALAAVARATLVAVGLVVLIMLVVEVQPAEAAFPGKNGKMAYSGWDGHDQEIYTIDPTGGNKVQLTHQPERRSSFVLAQRQEDRQESC